MATYTFSYTDAALAPLAAFMPELHFILSKESFGFDGQLISDRAVPGVLFPDGTGYVMLVPNDLIQGNTYYRVVGTFLNSAGSPVSMDLFTFRAAVGGGPISEMIDIGLYNPAQLIVSETEPAEWPVGWVWANPLTGDVYRRTAVGIEFLGNWRGPQGLQGAQGVQGLPGVNAVANDTATAGYITTAGTSQTKTALETRYAATGIPAAVASMTRQGKVQKNAVKVLRPLQALIAARDSFGPNIVVVGDSVAAGVGASAHEKRWVSLLNTFLRGRFPAAGKAGGRGYIAAGNTAPTSFAWPAVLAGGASYSNDDYGPNRGVVGLPAGGTITYSLVGTSADIIFVKAAGFGTFSWKVDGGAATNVSTNAATTADGSKVRISLGAAGAHTLVIANVSGAVFIGGVNEFNGSEFGGITVHDCGHSGFTTGDWVASPFDPVANWPAAVAALNPSILLVPLGINDVNTSVSTATFQANLTSLIAKLRAPTGMSDKAIVFVAYYAMGGKLAAWQGYVDAMYAAAEADGNALVADLTTRLWNYDDAGRGDVFVDTAHPNDIGHAMIAQYLAEFLSPS